jgi:hypothetical protein
MKQYFDEASIVIKQNCAIIDATHASCATRHRKVVVEQTDHGYKISAEKVLYDFNIPGSGTVSIEDAADDYIIEYHPWPWSKNTKKRVAKGIVELKKTDPRIYEVAYCTIIKSENYEGGF